MCTNLAALGILNWNSIMSNLLHAWELEVGKLMIYAMACEYLTVEYYFVVSQTIFKENSICRLQQYSNLDRWSRRCARWPQYHHYCCKHYVFNGPTPSSFPYSQPQFYSKFLGFSSIQTWIVAVKACTLTARPSQWTSLYTF